MRLPRYCDECNLPGEELVTCKECSCRYHAECAGTTMEEYEENAHWVCRKCSDVSAKPRRRS